MSIFNDSDAKKIYKLTSNWITSNSIGEIQYISVVKDYEKKLWNHINEKIRYSNNTSEINRFKNEVVYSGELFRIHRITDNQRKLVYPSGYHQHWCKDLKSINNIQSFGYGLLIIGNTNQGISPLNLINYLKENNNNIPNGNFSRYENENEIAAPLGKKNINKMYKIQLNELENYKISGIEIEPSNWFKKTRSFY